MFGSRWNLEIECLQLKGEPDIDNEAESMGIMSYDITGEFGDILIDVILWLKFWGC